MIPYEDIERVAAPSPAVFLREYVRRAKPVVLTGLTDEWPARRRWSVEHLAQRFGATRVVAMPLRDGTLDFDPWSKTRFELVPLKDVVDSLHGPGGATHYVMAPIAQLPRLGADLSPPPYCATAPTLRVKLWLGKAGTVTPLHWDLPHNLHSVIEGRKRFVLFSPRQWLSLYSHSPFSGVPNFSRVDPENPDLACFPRFRRAGAVGCVLGPGDTVFIPRGWWHHTRSLETGISVNFWWGGPGARLVSAAALAFKRWRGIYRNEWG
jgi:lysine-specific demethylase 8